MALGEFVMYKDVADAARRHRDRRTLDQALDLARQGKVPGRSDGGN